MTGLYKAAYPYEDDVLALPVQGHRPGHEAVRRQVQSRGG